MRFVVVVCACLVMLVAPARAQSLTTGAIQGVVTDDATELPIAAVTVSAGGQSTFTEVDGSFKITELLPATYDVTFEYSDSKVVHHGVVVSVDGTTTLYQKMKSGEQVEVHGAPPSIRLDSTAHETRIDRTYLENMPLPGPDFTSAIGTIGGATNDGVGIAFSGSTSLENRYIVDGIDITGLTFGDVGTPVLNEFIQEMNVISGGYSAEYGRATGGIVNIVTRSGTNEFRGSIFGVITPGFLTARTQTSPVNASSIDVTANQAYTGNLGFELGGPIIKDRAWFYVGVSPQASQTDYTRTTKRETDCRKVLPSGQLSNCDPANADGIPDIDPKTGFYITDALDSDVRSATSKSLSTLAKINVAVSPANQGQVSLIALPSESESPGLYGLPTSGTKASGLTTDAAARWTSKFGNGATELEGVVAWHRSSLNSGSIDPTLNGKPLQILEDGNLGTWGALGGESAATQRGCGDGASTDPYPDIVNCPMQSRSYSIGGPGSLQHDLEDRRAVRLSAIERVRAWGTHEIKAGLDYEDESKQLARLFSGGSVITNDIGADTVKVQRWVQLAAPTDTDPRFDQTCSTPAMSASGVGMASTSFRCAYLGGTVGAPGTEVGGETVNWAAYLRDSWQVTNGLTINVGVRYEQQLLKYAAQLRGTTDPLTGNHIGENAMDLSGNYAPRLGVIWDPTREGRSKIYAHWGRFYESIPMDINDRSFGGEVTDTQTFTAKNCGPTDPRLGGTDGTSCLTTSGKPDQETLIGSSGVLVAPGIKAEYEDEILAGAELAVIPNVVVGVNVQHRALGRVIEDVSTDGANTYIIANPGEWSTNDEHALEQQIALTSDPTAKSRLSHELDLYRGIRIFDKPTRDYNAVEITVSRKFAPGLFVQGSYTYSKTDGNYPGSVSYDNGQVDPNISSQYDLIELLENRAGPLPQDRPHSIKLDGYYTYDLGGRRGAFTLGARVRAVSGVPENALAAHYLYGPNESFLLPRGLLGRTEFDHGVDLHLAYRRAIGTSGTSFELYTDVFNVYDNQGVFSVDDTYAPQFRAASPNSAGGTPNNVNPISGGTYEDLIWAKTIDEKGNETPVPTARNPNFRNPTSRYAPTSAQIGFRLRF